MHPSLHAGSQATMSLLKYFSRESEIDQSTVSRDPGIQDDNANNSEWDASGSELTERERSLEDDIVSESRFPQVTGAVSSGSSILSSLPDISESLLYHCHSTLTSGMFVYVKDHIDLYCRSTR